MLATMLSPTFLWNHWDPLVDARLPAAGQLDKFAALGYATIPTAGEVMKRMVKFSEAEEKDLLAEEEHGRLIEEEMQADWANFVNGGCEDVEDSDGEYNPAYADPEEW